MILTGLFLIAAMAILVMKGREEQVQLQKRYEELLMDYPGLIMKFTLLVQAGMAAEVGEIYWTGVHNSASIFYRYAVILAKFLQTVKLRPRRSCQNAEDLQFVNCQARQCD
mgnify:CR=1 FL=1